MVSTTHALLDFYPRSPCGERPRKSQSSGAGTGISIHALLAESDERANRLAHAPPQISIHALLAESDVDKRCEFHRNNGFLSTLSLRRATVLRIAKQGRGISFLSTLSLRRATIGPLIFNVQPRNFYPRSPCGERQGTKLTVADVYKISIHALLAESDKFIGARTPYGYLFLSTLSLRRATHGVRIAKIDFAFLSTLSLRRATRR